jgi:hypothetical protein
VTVFRRDGPESAIVRVTQDGDLHDAARYRQGVDCGGWAAPAHALEAVAGTDHDKRRMLALLERLKAREQPIEAKCCFLKACMAEADRLQTDCR